MKDSTSKKEIVYNGIYNKLLSCEAKYRPGNVINESELMVEFECSKTPVREALGVLCNKGMLRSVPRYGYIVEAISKEEVIDMLEYRICIEKNFLKNNFLKFTDAQIEELAAIDLQLQDSKVEFWENWQLHWDLNVKFHITMLSFCNNKYALEMMERCLKRMKRAYAQIYRKIDGGTMNRDSQKALLGTRNHEGILDALRTKNETKFMECLIKDILDFGDLKEENNRLSRDYKDYLNYI